MLARACLARRPAAVTRACRVYQPPPPAPPPPPPDPPPPPEKPDEPDETGTALASALRPRELGSLRAALGIELLVHLSRHVALAAGPKAWFDLLFDDGARAALAQMPASPEASRRIHLLDAYRVQIGLSVSLLFGL